MQSHAIPGTTGARPAGSRAILEVSDLTIGFGDGPDVLAGVELTVGAGEFVTLLGPSGCGKSTLLNLTAGLLSPRRGRVSFDGRPITGVNTAVGYMTQDDTLLPWRSVAANIGLPLRMRKVAKAEVAERVARYLGILDLDKAAGQYPAQLSGGMRRRALLARSMIYEPTMLLMDEPFAALDAQMRRQMHQELRRTVTALNQTVLFVTHDIAEAALLSDRVLVVGGGPPGRILTDIAIPFGAGDRDMATLPFEHEFTTVERELHDALTSARSAAPAEKGGRA